MGITPAIIGAAAISGGASMMGASAAADAQTSAAQQSAATQLAMFNQTQANLAPFIGMGTRASSVLSPLIGTAEGTNPLTAPLTKPFTPADLTKTPGYQFTLGEGLKSVQNGYAAKGLGSSGAAMKGAAQYAEGLAGNTWNQQFQNYLAQNSQVFNMLNSGLTIGANAAANLGTNATNVGANVGNAYQAAGNAQAAGYNGMAAGLGNAVNNGLSGYMNNAMMSNIASQGAGQTGELIDLNGLSFY